MPFIVATYVYASSQEQRMHSARTNLTLWCFQRHVVSEHEHGAISFIIMFVVSKTFLHGVAGPTLCEILTHSYVCHFLKE